MHIAAKYEEIRPPSVDYFVDLCADLYTRREILHMEGMILNRLNFELTAVTTEAFLPTFLKAAECDMRTGMLCRYLCELTLQEYSFLKYRPSEIAAAGLRLALHTMRLPAWTPRLEQISGYSAADLAVCVEEMLAVFRKAESSKLQAVREKYSPCPRDGHGPNKKLLGVSALRPPEEAPPVEDALCYFFDHLF